MVDYDGQDAIKTYLNGLAWTALTKPTFFFDYETIDAVYTNRVIILETGITPARLNHDEYVLNHHVELRLLYNSKATLYPHMWYTLENLMKLTAADSNYLLGEIITDYSTAQKTAWIEIDYSEKRSIS